MILKLDSEKEKKKFYRLLPLYKSIIFRGVMFESNSNDEDIQLIIGGLNIKKRKKRIMYVFDEACKMIDNYYKGKNVCGFKDRKCYAQQCSEKEYYNGCCRLCRYQSDTGCTSSNLACKLFMCSEVKSRYDILTVEDIKLLKLFSMKNRFLVKSDYFSKREDVLKDLYTFTLTYAGLRVVCRLIRDYVVFCRGRK